VSRRAIDEWVEAGLIDAALADRIRAFEDRRKERHENRWPALLAWSFGGILLGAGVLLFVSAHWDRLSPAWRFSVVLLLVAVFHLAASAVGSRFGTLASVLHVVGTVSLGAGIFMAGQIFHLQEHWPGGIMLWAVGSWVAWAVLRDWPQVALAAVLTPAWLAGEWIVVIEDGFFRGEPMLGASLVLLAATYLSARLHGRDGPLRRALAWIGGLALIPCVLYATFQESSYAVSSALPVGLAAAGWILGLSGPLLVALLLRGRAAWMNAAAAVWAVGLVVMNTGDWTFFWDAFGVYMWCLLGSIGLVAWGIGEARPERINLGTAGFAITVTTFYFSSVMDKLGRASSLIGLGVLFLLGGWMLERLRRRLVARARTAA
jgi:uncharacterized membrane protein